MRRRRRVVSRNVVIGLGVLCVILLFALIGAVAYYQNYVTASNISNLQVQIDSLTRIVNLEESMIIADGETISQPAGHGSGINFTANYVGYVVVDVTYSSTENTTVSIMYTSVLGEFYFKEDVGSGKRVWYAVLPAYISVLVGNENLYDSATETVSITYYY